MVSAEQFWGARLDGALVGVLTIEPVRMSEFCVSSLVVAPDRQRRGVGRALLQTIVEQYAPYGCSVWTAAGNAPALALYEQFGFFPRSSRQAGALQLIELFRPHASAGPWQGRSFVRFSPSSANDAEALVSLRIEAMRESLESIGRFDPIRARERFLSGFDPEHTRHVELNGERVGFFVLKPNEQGLLLDHLYIRPQHQGKRIGAVVLAQVFAEADAQGLPVRVGALRSSDSNRFYLRHGFQLTGQSEFDLYYLRTPPPEGGSA
jgi:GNAT superfamily N-acetyltransferase